MIDHPYAEPGEIYSRPGNGSSCVVSVVTHPHMRPYMLGLERLKERLDAVGHTGGWMMWHGYPAGSPPHDVDPYAFKLFAIEAAMAAGYKRIIWADAEAFPVRPLGPLFDVLCESGVVSVSGNDLLGEWCSDACLDILGITRAESFGGDMWVQAGKVYGIDFGHPTGREFFDRWCNLWLDGAFRGPAINTGAGPEVEVASRAALGHRPTGFCSADPRVRGHRHDEIAAGYLVAKMGIPSGKVCDWVYGGSYSPTAVAKPDVYFCGAPGDRDVRM